MYIAAICIAAAVLLYNLIVILFGKNAGKQDAVRSRLYKLGKESSGSYLITDEDMAKPFTERFVKPLVQGFAARITSIIPVGRAKNGADATKRMLQQAGWTISVEEYTAIQLILMISCGVTGLVASLLLKMDGTHILLYTMGGVYGAYTLLRFYTTSTATKRKTAMEKQLPDMLDLLSVSVAAGLGFERAMLHIIETMDGPLIDEFAVSYREMTMGRSRKDALSLLGERCGVEDLSSVTSAIVQAGQLGIPIKNVLNSQSAAIRRSRKAKVQEKAAKISTKILLPMVGLIFPVLIIVLMGPSILTIMEQFS